MVHNWRWEGEGWGESWGTETEYVVLFHKRPVDRSPWPLPVSIRAIALVCPQVIFFSVETDVVLFRNALPVIRPGYPNNKSFSSELSLKYTGECSVSLWLILFSEIWTWKVEKLPISRKFELCPLITGPNIDLAQKHSINRDYPSKAIYIYSVKLCDP